MLTLKEQFNRQDFIKDETVYVMPYADARRSEEQNDQQCQQLQISQGE